MALEWDVLIQKFSLACEQALRGDRNCLPTKFRCSINTQAGPPGISSYKTTFSIYFITLPGDLVKWIELMRRNLFVVRSIPSNSGCNVFPSFYQRICWYHFVISISIYSTRKLNYAKQSDRIILKSDRFTTEHGVVSATWTLTVKVWNHVVMFFIHFSMICLRCYLLYAMNIHKGILKNANNDGEVNTSSCLLGNRYRRIFFNCFEGNFPHYLFSRWFFFRKINTLTTHVRAGMDKIKKTCSMRWPWWFKRLESNLY